MKQILLIGILLSSTLSFADKLEFCVENYAKYKVQEYNMPNDSLVSKDPKALSGVLSIIKREFAKEYSEKAIKASIGAQAIGVVLNYEDEVHLIYVAVKVVAGKCAVKELADVNTADISYSKELSIDDLDKFFLLKPAKEVPNDDVYNDVKTALSEIRH